MSETQEDQLNATNNVWNITLSILTKDTPVSGPVFEFGPKRDPLEIVIPLTIIYSLIFITGFIGNISTCVVIRKNRSLHTATNYYLFSLAISDFLLLISGVPQEIYFIWSKYPYIFGEYFCIGRGLIAEMSANATVLTITAFSAERYVAICHPFVGQAMSKLSRAVCIIILIWIISILTAIPQVAQFGLVTLQGIDQCIVVRIILEHSFQISTIIFFFVPMSIIMILYILIGLHLHRSHLIRGGIGGDGGNKTLLNKSIAMNGNPILRRSRLGMKSTQSDTILYRYTGGSGGGNGNRQIKAVRHRSIQFNNRRVLRMLVAVVICFFLCWAPFHAQRLTAIYGWGIVDDGSHIDVENHLFLYTVLTYTSGVLYFLSTCINPILYNLMSNKFRQAFKAILFGKRGNITNHPQQSQSSRITTLKTSIQSRETSLDTDVPGKISLLQSVLNDRKLSTEIIP
uniref:G-protein coupled receptors family 1 profile domain-containing protein n=1 Tax=Glossina brevipalpis TaxID=37001 RepID=A0A1A9WT55_9MUSC